MRPKNQLIAGALVCGLSWPMTGSALQVAGDMLEIYGVVRLSVDYVDSDLGGADEDPAAGLTDGSFGLSANTTVIGLRGAYDINEEYRALWQLEQNFDPDQPRGRSLGNRDTFLGFETPFGRVRAGIMDTPYKLNALRLTQFVTTVADPFAIISKGSGGGQRLALRAENSLMWDHRFFDGRLHAHFQYGFGQNDTPGAPDDNDSDVWSTSLFWADGGLNAGIAYEDWSELYGTSVQGLNFGANYRFGALRVGAIFDRLEADDIDFLNRDAWGAYVTYDFTPAFTLGTQWMHADESDAGDDSADQYSLVGMYRATPQLMFHAAATITVNDDDAMYRTADYAHGDNVNTVPGGDPRAFSVGAALSF